MVTGDENLKSVADSNELIMNVQSRKVYSQVIVVLLIGETVTMTTFILETNQHLDRT